MTLRKLQLETIRNDELEQALAQLKDENYKLRSQLLEMRNGAQRGETTVAGDDLAGGSKTQDESKIGSRPMPASEKKKKKKKKSKKSKRSRKDKSSLIDDHIKMGRSAEVVQSHMRGFLARKKMQERIENHLDEDIDIPDFGHLDAIEPSSPLLLRVPDRKSMRK